MNWSCGCVVKMLRSIVTMKHSTPAAGEAKSSWCSMPCGDEWSPDVAYKYLRTSWKFMEMIRCSLGAFKTFFRSLTENVQDNQTAILWYRTRALTIQNRATPTSRCILRPASSALEVCKLYYILQYKQILHYSLTEDSFFIDLYIFVRNYVTPSASPIRVATQEIHSLPWSSLDF